MGIINLTKPNRPQRDMIPPNLSKSRIFFWRGNIFLKSPQLPGSPTIDLIVFPTLSQLGQHLARLFPGLDNSFGSTRQGEPPPHVSSWGTPQGQLSPYQSQVSPCRDQIRPFCCPRVAPHHRSPVLGHTLYFEREAWDAFGHRAVPRPILFTFDSIKLWPFGLFPN